MPEFSALENTLFIPMLGRIYASEHFRNILYDETALSLKDALPKDLADKGSQSQYTLLASASRSANMDRYVQSFLRRKPGGVIAELGGGLETTYYRNDDGHTRWYAVDLPDVLEYREALLPKPQRQACLAGDAFSGSGGSAAARRTRRYWLPPAACSTISKRRKWSPFCGCCTASRVWRWCSTA